MAKCPICDTEMASDRRGPKRLTCSPACRQAAYRRRKAEETEHPPVNNEPSNVQGVYVRWQSTLLDLTQGVTE